jgi:nucleoside-diphosphate-sugar epimerase
MTEKNFLILGAGYSGQAFARTRRAGERILGTTRSDKNFPALQGAGIKPLLFDGSGVSESLAEAIGAATHVVVSAAPGDDGDPVLRACTNALLAAPNLAWIGYLSTVGVYGDHEGAWVDESAECRPTSRRSMARIEAEREWLAFGERRGVPVAILRLSGIYGPGRNAFVNLANGTARRLVKPGQVFNRIFVDDIAGALRYLADRGIGGIFNLTDDLPAPPQDVVAHAAEIMGVEPPPEIAFDTAELTPMQRSFYGENKRVSNAAIKKSGYLFQYPDYRFALAALWRDGNWRGTPGDRRSPIGP